jgi:hypothetical protein
MRIIRFRSEELHCVTPNLRTGSKARDFFLYYLVARGGPRRSGCSSSYPTGIHLGKPA